MVGMPQKLTTYLTEAALGQRRPSLASCFLGELIHRPTGRWSFPKRGLPPSFRSPDSMALREKGKVPSPKATGARATEKRFSSGSRSPGEVEGESNELLGPRIDRCCASYPASGPVAPGGPGAVGLR